MSLFRDDGIVLRTQEPGAAGRIMLRCCGGRPPCLRREMRGGAR